MRVALMLTALLMSACGKPDPEESLNLRTITLPGGRKIYAEVLMRRDDMSRGMMFRPALAPDRGLLFVHGKPAKYTYWMHNVRVPLDILFIDADKTIVDISADTPPCTSAPADCPQYGGKAEAMYVLEIAGGQAAQYGLRPGSKLDF